MKLSKINILEGDWLGKPYHQDVLPRLQDAKIPTFKQETIPLTRLYDSEYWGGLRSVHKIDIAMIDYHHWTYEDSVFAEYIDKLSSIYFPAVCMFESPYGYEMPPIDVDAFSRKLFDRTRIVVKAIRKKQPKTRILSPAIGVVDEKYSDRYLEYFIHNRNNFDVYAVHCCNDMTEHSLAKITAILAPAVKAGPKPVWVTKWAIPSFEGQIFSSRTIGGNQWEPIDFRTAAQKLKRSFSLIERAAQKNSHWFYVGLDKDAYHSNRAPSIQEYWAPHSTIFRSDSPNHYWDFHHFLGMVKHNDGIKEPLLESFLELANVQNNK